MNSAWKSEVTLINLENINMLLTQSVSRPISEANINKTNRLRLTIAWMILALVINESYFHNSSFAWYDPLWEAVDRRTQESENFEKAVSSINYSATDIQTIKNNLSLIYTDYQKRKWTSWSAFSIRFRTYWEYLNKILKSVSNSLDKETFRKYNKMKEELLWVN